MKVTDYASRTAFMDTFLTTHHKIGLEVGVDVGAHAESLLIYCPWLTNLMLVDPWDKDWYYGYCNGRLCRFRNIEYIRMKSLNAASVLMAQKGLGCIDFIYLDQEHEYTDVREDLRAWWPLLDEGGILGHRNYSNANPGLMRAVDEFVRINSIKTKHDSYHNEIVLFK